MRTMIERLLLVGAVIVLLAGASGPYAVGAELKREIAFYADYPSLAVGAGDEVSLDLTLENRGDVSEDVDLNLVVPEAWKAMLTAWATKDAEVRSVHLEPAQETPRKLTLKTTVPKTAEAGRYSIQVMASTRDLAVQRSLEITIEVTEEGAGYTGPAAIELKPDYQSLGAAPGGNVEFRIDVTNKSAEDRTFEFAADVPALVDVQFMPASDRTKQVTSLNIAAGETATVIMKLTLGADVAPGSFPVKFSAASQGGKEETEVRVDVKGKGKLLLGTIVGSENEQALNGKTTAGKAVHFTLITKNDGTGALNNITFTTTVKPKDWTVEFTPAEVSYLAPGESMSVDVAITPRSKAIAGDYRVQVVVRSPGESGQNVDFRVQVETSSKWLWIAVVIIVAVLAALLGVFLWLRRR